MTCHLFLLALSASMALGASSTKEVIARARALKSQGKLVEAIQQIKSSPAKDDPVGRFNLACYQSLLGRTKEAAATIEQLVDQILATRPPSFRRLQVGLFSDPDLIPLFRSKYWPRKSLARLPLGQHLYACPSPFSEIGDTIQQRAKLTVGCKMHKECQTIVLKEYDASRSLLFDPAMIGESFYTTRSYGVKSREDSTIQNIESDVLSSEDLLVWNGVRPISLADERQRVMHYNQCQTNSFRRIKEMIGGDDENFVHLLTPNIKLIQSRESLFCIRSQCREPTETDDHNALLLSAREEIEPGYSRMLEGRFQHLVSLRKTKGVPTAFAYYLKEIYGKPFPANYSSMVRALESDMAKIRSAEEQKCRVATEDLPKLVSSLPRSCQTIGDCLGIKLWDCCGGRLIAAVTKTQRSMAIEANLSQSCKNVDRPVCDCEIPSDVQTYDCIDQQCRLVPLT